MYQFYVKIRNLNTVKINSLVWLCKWNSNMRNNKFIIKKISEFGNNIGIPFMILRDMACLKTISYPAIELVVILTSIIRGYKKNLTIFHS